MPDTQTSCRSGWRIRLADDVAILDEGGHVFTLRSRKARALLALLACSKDHETTRAEVIGLLWSDRGRDQARASLRQCLFAIRSEADGLIISDGERIALVAVEVSELPRHNGHEASPLSGLDDLDPAFDRWLAKRRSISEPGGSGESAGDRAAGSHQASSPPVLPWRASVSKIRTLGIATLVLLVGAGWLVFRHHAPVASPGLPVIAIVPFAAIPDTPEAQAIAERLVGNARAWMPADRAVVRVTDLGGDRLQQMRWLGADWVVSGTVDGTRSPGIVRVRIEAPDGRLIWSRDVDAGPGGLADAGATAATRLGMVVTCALGGPPLHRRPEVLTLLMDACDKLDFAVERYSHEAAMIALHRLAAGAPGDALAQAYLGTGLAVTAGDLPPAIASAQRAESALALTRAERLDPRVGETWLGRRELLQDPRAFGRAETLLARGLAVEPNSPHLNAFMAGLLSDTGREEEALVYARRAAALDPALLNMTAHVAELLAATGQPSEALAVLDAADALHPRNMALRGARFSILMRGGNMPGARALLDRANEVPGWIEGTANMRRQTFAIEHPHSLDANAMARELIVDAAAYPERAGRPVLVLASLGRPDPALDIAMKYVVPPDIFFRPSSKALLMSPRFPEVARTQGLWAYWSNTGHWPDICRDPKLPWKCGAVKNASMTR